MGTYLDNLVHALRGLLSSDSKVFILGEDIRDPYGGAFKVTKGLSTAFPERVLNTPISEAAIIGVAVGMAMRGLRPIVEIMFGDFITLCVDQIVNHATKFPSMYAGQVKIPLVVRTPMGGGRGYGPTHSQSLEKLFLGIPSLKVVAPSHFHEPGPLLCTAIQAEQPILFVEHKLLYPKNLLLDSQPPLWRDTVGQGLSETVVVTNYPPDERKADLVMLAYGGMSSLVERVLRKWHEEEIWIKAMFPCLISDHLPVEAKDELEESRRFVVVEEGPGLFGWTAEMTWLLHEWVEGRSSKHLRIRRITASDTIIPAAKHMEAEVLPSEAAVEAAILEVLE